MGVKVSVNELRAEISVAAARLIAEEGLSYGEAKYKAAEQVIGKKRVPKDVMPTNKEIEDEVRIYNQLYLSDTQPVRLRNLREVAVVLMEELADFRPYIVGAVWNGTAGEHSDIYLELFVDNPKEVEIFLLNLKVDFEVSERPHFQANRDYVEVLSFFFKKEGVHAALYPLDDLRGALKQKQNSMPKRGDLVALQALLAEDKGI